MRGKIEFSDTITVSTLRFWAMVGTALFATVFWESPFLIPFKYLTVLLHELWHGLVALLSGADIETINLSVGETGKTFVTGLKSTTGFIFSVSAGYVGTAMTGALLLRKGMKGNSERLTVFILSIMLLYMSQLFTDYGKMAFFVGSGWAVFLFISFFAGKTVSRYILITLGTLFIWYSLYDMFDFTGMELKQSDAWILSTFLKKKGWPGFQREANVMEMAKLISIIWSTFMICGTILILWSALHPASLRTAQNVTNDKSVPDTNHNEATLPFPGEVSPEVAEWLLTRGVSPDGTPILPDCEQITPSGEIPVYNEKRS